MTKKWIATGILTLSAVFYALGLYFPLLTTKTEFIIVWKYHAVRLFDSVKIFYDEHDYLLAGIIFIFAVVLPIVKYLDLYNTLFGWIKFSPKTSAILHKIDKWSMIDVFLVALLLLNFKLNSNIIVMNLEIGTTFIALSVIFRMVASELVESVNSQKSKFLENEEK